MVRFGICFFSFFFFYHCSIFRAASRIKPLEFNYTSIAVNYFTPENEKPFPLTVQRGNNLYNSTTADGSYLFYTTGQKGNYDIWFRDLKSSITVPVTTHPAPEYKPAISPDGKKLVFVSEQYDSSGDLILLKMNPGLWADKILQGKRFINSDFIILTNSNFSDTGKKDSYVDTDPFFAPDGRHLVFSTDRLTPGIQNLVVLDTEGKEPMKLLTQKGGASPFWSKDGKSIVYISYQDGVFGDVYLLDLSSGKNERLTKDSYLNFSPSLSEDKRYLYYTSIQNDTNRNGRLDERDNSLIVRKDLKTGVVRRLTSGNDSLFDSRFSAFNGGSILFTAAYYDTLNIYFIPASGSVSKEKDIISQYELALKYKEKQSFEDFLLAIDAIEFYFSQDPIYPLIFSKALLLKYEEAKNSGRTIIAENAKKEILSSRLNPVYGLAYGLFLSNEKKLTVSIQELRKYYEQIRAISDTGKNLLASLLEEEGDLARKSGDSQHSLKVYDEIIIHYPDYYRIRDVYRKSGDLQYKNAHLNHYKIPEPFFRVANDLSAGKEDLKLLYERIDGEVVVGKSFSEKINASEISIESNSLENKSPRLFQYFLYIKSLGLNGKGSFEESNSLLNTFLSKVAKSDPLFLKIHLLKSNNFKGLGEVQKSFDELRIYLEEYDPLLGVDLEEKEIERSFIYFENKARDHDRRGNLQDAAFHYFYNTENMFLVKSRNLFLESLYKEFAVYYQRMMVDAVFKLSGSLSEERKKALLNQLDVIDIAKVDPLAEEGLVYINQYYKEAVPRARPVLDLATLYGYSYYLINRSVIRETYYNSTKSMTSSKKEEILRDFKQAEYELRWIIFADPRYYEAYQLLGWMYQYVDILKNRKSGEDQPSDEEKYISVYEKYFPEKNFEENIELYSQVLELLGDNFENKKALSDLRLNLGNNYFLLKNYPKANEQYSKVDSLSDYIISKTQFEDYRQKAIFLFNSARSSIYVADYKSAIQKLKAASDIYFRNESKKTIVGKDSVEKLEQYKLKLALLFTLTGLSYMEAGEYSNAIPYYKDALSLNGENGWIDPVNLHNGLALCYQKLGKYKLSELHLTKADKIVDDRVGTGWIPRGVKLAFWDYFWDWVWEVALPDGVRISGEGRFPEAISPKFQPLMTSGIRVNNLIASMEIDGAIKEINSRLAYVKSKSLGTTLAGSLIGANSLNDLGYLHFKRDEFKNAIDVYEQAEKFETEKGFAAKARTSFKRKLYSYFGHLENTNEDPELELRTLGSAAERILSSKSDFIKGCLGDVQYQEELIYSETKKCILKFYNSFSDHDPTLALIYYYQGEQFFRMGNFVAAFEFFGKSAGLLENPSLVPKEVVGLADDPYSRKERLSYSISRANLYVRLEDSQKAISLLELASETANEFYYIQEWIEALVTQAEIFRKEKNDFKAKEKIDKASALLLSHPHLISELKYFIIYKLFKIQSELNFQSGKFSDGFKSLDRLHKLKLYRQFIKIPHESEDPNFTEDITKLQNLIKKQKFYYSAIQNALEKKEKSESLLKKYVQLSKDLEKELVVISRKNQDLDGYLGIFIEEPSVTSLLDVNEGYLRIESAEDKIRIYRATSYTEEYLVNTGKLEEVLNQISNSGKIPFVSKKIWFVQLGDRIDFEKIRNFLPEKFSLVFRPSHLKPVREKDRRTTRNVAIVDGSPNFKSSLSVKKITPNQIFSIHLDTDMLVSPFPNINEDNSFGESLSEKNLAVRDLFHNQNEISSALFYEQTKPHLGKISELYEVLNASGIRNVAICNASDSCATAFPEKIFSGEISGSLFLGSSVLRKKDVFISLENLSLLVRENERKDNVREAYTHAFSYRSFLKKEDMFLAAELDVLRLKWKLSPQVTMEEIYGDLLQNTKLETVKDSILFSALLNCYLDKNLSDCNSYSFKDITDFQKRNLLKNLYLLKNGASVEPLSLKVSDKTVFSFYDPYLYYKNILKIARANYEPELGEFAGRLALEFTHDPDEIIAVEEILQGLYAQKYFLQGSALSKNQIRRKEELYLILSGNWKEALRILKEKEAEEDTGKFRERLFRNWRREITGAWFSPYSLYSEVYGNSSKLFESLDAEERSLLYHLILYSIPFQENEELDLLTESLVEYEWNTGAKSRALRMVLGYSQALFSRGELSKSKDWMDKIDSRYKTESKSIFRDKNILNNKLLFHLGKISSVAEGDEKTEWLLLYEKAASKPPNEFVEFLNSTIRSKRGNRFSSKERAELLDWIVYLQKLCFKKNNSEVFFDLVLAKDLLSLTRPVVLNSIPDYKDIPTFVAVADKLKEKLPADQEFLAVTDLGLETFYIRFLKGKSKGDLAFKDNRKLRASLFQYLEEAAKGGYEVLLREELENEYRRNVKLAKNKLTYLYLSSYHFRIPLVPRTEDKFYLVNDPQSLVSNPIVSTKEEFSPEYRIQFLENSKLPESWKKSLKELEVFEAGSGKLGSDSKSRLYILQDPLEIVDQVHLSLGGKALADSYGSPKKGNWIFTSSFLDDEYYDIINYRDSFYWISQNFQSPGVIFIGEQTDTAHVDFLKRFTKRSLSKVPLYIRFQETLDAIKEAYPLDRIWNGYRLYTNSIILEE
ncbi:WD40-like protein [Leptospira interrogans str. 2003000735]|uniref:PD40 domain-containing protein n=1 Tax=Leptospira interrogans TaxID=173 RepID=UPI0002921AEE|nr:PD40 domain-containing protein [Leptospira interrogans]EKN89468.1 WD40-like protein [Leptospira interrogans str. 2002000624]EKQ36978.1 WD40-like protein [Leptospira interrogans str. 2002000621]EKQ45502.1 WD40-like protein [Leptospira interrogans str. 2002000623]EMJ68769.1 WD40-like protein [Leptospira interrogans str. 2002000632]EMJ72967.1 WD40-like protein [Leptospira interrogans str. 2003000735]